MKNYKVAKEWKDLPVGSIIRIDEKQAEAAGDSLVEFTREMALAEAVWVADREQDMVKDATAATAPKGTEVRKPKKSEIRTLFGAVQKLISGESKEITLRTSAYGKALADAEEKAPTGLNESTDDSGGFLVTHELADNIYGVAMQGSVLIPRVEVLPVGPNANGMKIPYVDNSGAISRTATPRGYWIAEGGQKYASKITFGQHDMGLGKLIMYIPITDELLEDRMGLQAWVLGNLRAKMGWMVDDAMWNLSTGTSGMMGILDAASAAFRTAPVAHANPYTPAIVNALISGVCPSLRGGAEWFTGNASWAAIAGTAGGVGPGVTLSTVPLVDVQLKRLGGYPVNVVEQLGAFGSGQVVFGNWREGYKLIQKGDIKLDISKDVRFDFDETVLRMVLRIAGCPVVREMTLPDASQVAAFSTTS